VPEGRPAAPAGTYGWFEDFLSYMLRHEWYDWFAKVIAVGEVLVGIGLIVGALVGIAAFFGTLMNFNFQLAGSASTNPVLFGLGVFLVLGWKIAGWIGLDRVLLPAIGTPWTRGRLLRGEVAPSGGQPEYKIQARPPARNRSLPHGRERFSLCPILDPPYRAPLRASG
jgi:thiosulfate dehydrogenase [quinone] large subunit